MIADLNHFRGGNILQYVTLVQTLLFKLVEVQVVLLSVFNKTVSHAPTGPIIWVLWLGVTHVQDEGLRPCVPGSPLKIMFNILNRTCSWSADVVVHPGPPPALVLFRRLLPDRARALLLKIRFRESTFPNQQGRDHPQQERENHNPRHGCVKQYLRAPLLPFLCLVLLVLASSLTILLLPVLRAGPGRLRRRLREPPCGRVAFGAVGVADQRQEIGVLFVPLVPVLAVPGGDVVGVVGSPRHQVLAVLVRPPIEVGKGERRHFFQLFLHVVLQQKKHIGVVRVLRDSF
mmetsp:Transcript_28626/g.72512  ORF Transcript_28626/g.72512 Transcript_28626/m.72512 type:complete len:288 (-) Transcript_28626:2063-2926(-)